MNNLLARLGPSSASGMVPTMRAALLAALAAPAALVVAAAAPAAWPVIPALGLTLLALVLFDALLAGPYRNLQIIAPGDCEVGEAARIGVLADLPGSACGRADLALSLDPRIAAGGRLDIRLRRGTEGEAQVWHGSATVTPSRRGMGMIARGWLRWQGPLGIGARQREVDLDQAMRVWPNLSAVRSPALQTFLKDSQFGLIARRMRGEGTQFEALADYQPGMDRRRIDWKASARHMHLYAKEYENERNNPIVFAFDCGQAMCEPVAGLPRIDRAVSAALATAYVALKGGDRVALYGFAARPELLTPFVTDARDFHRLQRAAAGLDYHAQEPNFTLALASLSGRLARRSMIVIFSDFTDPTSAELMIESVSRLVSRHVVLFVTMHDAELDEIAGAEPDSMGDLAMAVSADGLLRQRALVLQRLRQIGVDVVEAPWDQVGTRVIDGYLRIKRAGRIG